MNCLADTHLFLWALITPKKISPRVRKILLESSTTAYVSVVTFWEISLKYSLGKLSLSGVLPEQLPSLARTAKFEILALKPMVAASFYQLPGINHKDPFDRLLAWQAINNNLTLLTKDKGFTDYQQSGLKILW